MRECGERVPQWWLTLFCCYCFAQNCSLQEPLGLCTDCTRKKGGKGVGEHWGCPFKSVFSVLFPDFSHPPPSTSTNGGALRAQELQ